MSNHRQRPIKVGPQLSRRQFLQAGAWAGLGVAASAMPLGSPWTKLAEAGQADQPRYGGTLTMWLGGDPPNFDVHQNSTYLTQHVTALCYNNLVRYDPWTPAASPLISRSAGR